MRLRFLARLKIFIIIIATLVIKEIKLKSRYKAKFLFSVVAPFSTFIVPLLVFRTLFSSIDEGSFGIWTPENYIIFILSGIFIVALVNLLPTYGKSILREKYWKTLPGIFLSPINIYNLLLSKLISELIIFIIPIGLIFILCFIIAEASLLTILLVMIIYFLASILFASIGLAIGAFRMSKEGNYQIFFLIVNLFLVFSCYKYPKEFFPEYLEIFIIWNPFYYYWDLIRLMLVFGSENIIFNPKYTFHFIIVISLSLIGPFLSVSFFDFVYKRYGLVGY